MSKQSWQLNRQPVTGSVPIVLCVASVMLLFLSNILTSIRVSLPDGVPYPFNYLGLTGAIFLMPFFWIISDIVSEVWGYKLSRLIGNVSVIVQLVASFILWASNKALSKYLTPDMATTLGVIGDVGWIVICSSAAAYLNDWIDDVTYQLIRAKNNALWTRVLGSTAVSVFVDNIAFNGLLFILNLAGRRSWGIGRVIGTVICSLLVRVGFEAVLLPLIKWWTNKLKTQE